MIMNTRSRTDPFDAGAFSHVWKLFEAKQEEKQML
jgi:hypothetical protein